MDYSYYSSSAVSEEAAGILAGLGMGFFIVILAISVLILVSQWKIYTKAGKPGWACLIPIYTNIVMLDVVKLDWWHILIMLFVPFAAVVYAIIIPVKLAQVFGKSGAFALLLIFLPVIGYPMLAFGKDQYQG